MPEVPVRDAATIMVVRDTEAGSGIEVLMLRRNARSDWLGGAHLFPGGAVDDEDRAEELAARCSGRSEEEANRLLGTETGGRGIFVAAIRECFEEAGLLLADDKDGPLSFGEARVAGRFEEWRRKLNSNETRFADICRRESLTLALDRLGYFSHWITPAGAPRRYDTRFFVAVLPAGQTALHDDAEVVDSIWMSPADALGRHVAGEIDMMFPTVKNLEAISGFRRSEELMAAASDRAEVPTIMPRVVVDGSEVRFLLPGEDGYEKADGLPPGESFPDLPARLRRHDGRPPGETQT